MAPTPETSSGSLTGKTAVVTGASIGGIGFETAVALAQRGAAVAIISRDKSRGEDAAAKIRELCGAGSPPVSVFLADMSLRADVKRVAEQLLAALPRIDILVNNAGLFAESLTLTTDGMEQTFATNHLGYFDLTLRLLPRLLAAPDARIVSVSSHGHHMVGGINWEDPGMTKKYGGFAAYVQSKLANIMFTQELDRRLRAQGVKNVTATCLHPGAVKTNIWAALKKPSVLSWFLVRVILPLFFRTSVQGAEGMIFLACDPEARGEQFGGKYFLHTPGKKAYVAPVAKHAQKPADDERLWALSEKLTQVSWPPAPPANAEL